MSTLREAAQQALEALQWHYRQGHSNTLGGFRLKIDEKALRELSAALAQQDEPQTIDEAMRLPRAMAQAYENGYKAGVAAEREACAQVCEQMPELEHGWRVTLPSDCAAAIRARGEQP